NQELRACNFYINNEQNTTVNGYNEYTVYECIFSEALTDVEFILSYYFNKDPYIRFNSTVGKFVGYTEFGVKNAERWNKGPELQKWTTELDRYCKPNIQIDHSDILVKSVVPKIRLRLDKQGRDDHLARLICSAYDFYPSAIDVYWLKDNKKVTGDVTATEEMADGDWYYQFHSHLDYTPKSGEKISCVVEHASSTKPIITDPVQTHISEFRHLAFNKIDICPLLLTKIIVCARISTEIHVNTKGSGNGATKRNVM
uniref:Ig-like domain-containing protein n=1 Tax=Astyanax mexicanus TaxID=7994 RepID=A0A8B9L6R9_ASTMX